MSYIFTEGKFAVWSQLYSAASPHDLTRIPAVNSPQHAHLPHHQVMEFANTQHNQGVPESELAELIWNGVKLHAMRLRDVIMQNPLMSDTPVLPPRPPAKDPPPPPPHLKMASLSLRRAACTHLTMERLYGSYPCSVCNRPSASGWVYCCTQDDYQEDLTAESTKSAPPPSMSYVDKARVGMSAHSGHQPSQTAASINEQRLPSAELTPWIQKAIQQGHYTPEQIAILRAQKQKVADTARASINQFNLDQTQRTPPQNTTPSKATTLQSLDANPHLPFPLINEVQETPSSATSTNPTPEHQTNQTAHQQKMFPYCKFLSCHACRPTYRDRAWLTFEDAIALDTPLDMESLASDTFAAPFASKAVMMRIGLRERPRPLRPRLRAHGGYLQVGDMGEEMYFPDEDGDELCESGVETDTEAEADVADQRVELARVLGVDGGGVLMDGSGAEGLGGDGDGNGNRTEGGGNAVREGRSRSFRQSMKRAFRGMLMTRGESPPFLESRDSRGPGERADSGETGSIGFGVGRAEEEEGDLGLRREGQRTELDEATSVVLPDEQVEEGGIVEDAAAAGRVKGVAVLEESVGLGRADVVIGV